MSAYNKCLSSREDDVDGQQPIRTRKRPMRCPDLVGFLAICAQDPTGVSLGLPPYSTAWPDLDDVRETGGSFHFRKIRTSTFPPALRRALPGDREFVAVKHPVVYDSSGERRSDLYSDIATELQIFRHPTLKSNSNIADFYGILYHVDNEGDDDVIVPALLMEYAEHGTVKDFQELGYARSPLDKVDILLDAGRGLLALHEAGLIHGDLKPSNLLVCKHPSRKFMVKLTDFGYAFTRGEEYAVGGTEHLEVVEADGKLDTRYTCQLDIYAFGLLLYVVFRNGVQFHDFFEEGNRRQDVKQLKRKGLLAPLYQIGLLRHMKKEKCLLMIICKILTYCLQPDPSRRFRSIAKVNSLLEFARDAMDAAEGNETTEQRPAESVRRLGESFRMGMQRLLEEYLNSFAEDRIQMPLVEFIRNELRNRITIEVDFYMGDLQPSGGESTVAFSISGSRALITGSLGLTAEPELAYKATTAPPANSRATNQFQFSASFMLDMPRLIGATTNKFTKLPAPVKVAIADCLSQIERSSSDITRRAAARFNLAVCHTTGYGVETDLSEASRLMLDAARQGSTEAQVLYSRFFQHMQGAARLDPAEELEWLRAAVGRGDRTALRRVAKTFGADTYREAKTLYCHSVLAEVCSHCNSEDGSDGPDYLCEQQDWIHWRKSILRPAILYDLPGLVERLLAEDVTLAGVVFDDGETPLLLASRMGYTMLVELLLTHGATATHADSSGVTALHWLVAFPDRDKESICLSLVRNGAQVDALARAVGNMPFGGTVFETPASGTPLHWAIGENDLASVEMLLSIGADPTVRAPGPNYTCLEMACAQTRSVVVRRLLEVPGISAQVTAFSPTTHSSDRSFSPMFYVTRPRTRWRRILECGVGFEREADDTMRELVRCGFSMDMPVLKYKDFAMSAIFAAVYHQCSFDIVRSILTLGGGRQIDSTFPPAANGTALEEAILHQDKSTFDILIEHGADINVVGADGLSPLQRAATAADNAYFVGRLLDRGAPLEPLNPSTISAFCAAVVAGNYKVADFLFKRGADRDRMLSEPLSPSAFTPSLPAGAASSAQRRLTTVLGGMLIQHTRNAAQRVKYLLELPDRPSPHPDNNPPRAPVSDGFIVSLIRGWPHSAFHAAVMGRTENPDDNEVTRLMMDYLLDKYGDDRGRLNNTKGRHHSTVLAMTAEMGNYAVLGRLLDEGADPNIADEYGRTPLDLTLWRHHYPHLAAAFAELSDDDIRDRLLVGRVLRFVHENTAQVLAQLRSFGAKTGIFLPPTWAEAEARATGRSEVAPRGLDWVMYRLKERGGRGEERQLIESGKPMPAWGSQPIHIPERPMQFSAGPGLTVPGGTPEYKELPKSADT